MHAYSLVKFFKIEVNSWQSATKPPDSCFCKTNTVQVYINQKQTKITKLQLFSLGHVQGGIWLDHQSLTILW